MRKSILYAILFLFIAIPAFADSTAVQLTPTDSVAAISDSAILPVDSSAADSAIASQDTTTSDSSITDSAKAPSTLEAPEEEKSWLARFNGWAFEILFYEIFKLPLIVLVLLAGALFFTFFFGFINVKGFKHAIDVVKGKYDNPNDDGDISHFKALTSALSATVGLGNIAGVAVAIAAGGPGAVFWMILTAFFGMSSKFISACLGQLFRKENADGSISGGPMYYLDIGISKKGIPVLGKVLGVIYGIMVMFAAFGGGNMFQANSTVQSFITSYGFSESSKYIIGIILVITVGIVILGGIKRIGDATSAIVPFMCGTYVLASIYVILANLGNVPSAISLIFSEAFNPQAVAGGFLGVLIQGVRRAAFSNEAGLGSASIAHAAAKTKEPIREGFVAMIGPFIDTMIVCLMTALVLIVSGVWNSGSTGVVLTTEAFQTSIPWFHYILPIIILLFAYSTMISWCYYGERGWIYIMDHFGESVGIKTIMIYRITFVALVFVGSVEKFGDVLDFSDVMILSLAFPNILGAIILAPEVLKHLKEYWNRLQSGTMKTYK